MTGKLMLPMMERSQGEAMDQMLRIASEGAMDSPLPRTADDFQAASAHGKGELFNCAEKVAKGFESMLESHRNVSEWIEANRNDRHLHVVADDLSEEIDWLLGPDFIWRAGYDRFRNYGRYFQAMEERIKRLHSLPQVKDDEKRERVQRLWDKWYPVWKKDPSIVAGSRNRQSARGRYTLQIARRSGWTSATGTIARKDAAWRKVVAHNSEPLPSAGFAQTTEIANVAMAAAPHRMPTTRSR